VLEDNGFGTFGFYDLALIQFCQIWMGIISTPIIRKLGYKFIFIAGGLTYVLFVASFILPAFRTEYPNNDSWYFGKAFIYGMLLLTSIINGCGSALVLVQVGNYVSECASEKNKGLYNSIFWCSLMASGIVGNLMAAYVIVDVKESTFYMIMTAICLASVLVFTIVPKPEKVKVKKIIS